MTFQTSFKFSFGFVHIRLFVQQTAKHLRTWRHNVDFQQALIAPSFAMSNNSNQPSTNPADEEKQRLLEQQRKQMEEYRKLQQQRYQQAPENKKKQEEKDQELARQLQAENEKKAAEAEALRKQEELLKADEALARMIAEETGVCAHATQRTHPSLHCIWNIQPHSYSLSQT